MGFLDTNSAGVELESAFEDSVGVGYVEPRKDLLHTIHEPRLDAKAPFILECGHGSNGGLDLLELEQSFQQVPECVLQDHVYTSDDIIKEQWQQIISGSSHHFVDLGAADFIRELSASFSEPEDERLMATYSTQALLSAGHHISNLAETLFPGRHGFESRQSVNELFGDGLPYGVMGVSRVYCDYNRRGVRGEPTRIALDEIHGVPILGNQNVSDVDLRKRRITLCRFLCKRY